MRTILSLSLALLLLAVPTFAQGAGQGSSGAVGKALKDTLKKGLTSSAGNIQQSFFDNLKNNLDKNAGTQQGQKLYSKLQRQNLSSKDVQKLMNGGTTTSEVKKWFGASRKQLPKVEKSIDQAVDQKNKDGFFGILIIVMVGDFGLDPSAEFCQQAGGARETISKEEFEKLVKSNVSTNSISDVFGFESKDDCKFMQEILNAMQSSCFCQHPMLESMGMGQPGKFDPSKFPPLEKGMPGADMPEDAMPGGMPCDSELPPCGFMGESFKEMLKKCGEGEPKPEKPKKKKKGEKESEEEGR